MPADVRRCTIEGCRKQAPIDVIIPVGRFEARKPFCVPHSEDAVRVLRYFGIVVEER